MNSLKKTEKERELRRHSSKGKKSSEDCRAVDEAEGGVRGMEGEA